MSVFVGPRGFHWLCWGAQRATAQHNDDVPRESSNELRDRLCNTCLETSRIMLCCVLPRQARG